MERFKEEKVVGDLIDGIGCFNFGVIVVRNNL